MSPLRFSLLLVAFAIVTIIPRAESQPPTAAAKPVSPALDRYGDALPPGARARLGTTRLRLASAPTYLAFSPDGKTLASADAITGVVLWDAATGKELHRFPARSNTGCPFTFSADGKTLAVMDNDQVLRFHDVATGKELRQLRPILNGIAVLALAPGGRTIAVVDDSLNLRVVDSSTGKELAPAGIQIRGPNESAPPFQPTALAFSADGKTLAAGANNGVIGQVVFWDIEMAKVVGRLPELGANIAALRFAPDGKTLAVRDAQQGTTTLFDKATGQVVRQLNGRGPYATQTDVFSPDNKLLATASGDTVCVEEPATGKEVRRLKQAVAGISALAFSPDGKVLATGTATHLIRLWDLATGKEVLPLGGHQGPVHQLAYSPDDKLLATSSIDRIVRLWDSATGKEVRQLTRPMPADEPVQAWAAQMAFARDGKTLAAIWHDGWLGRWDVATGKLLNQFEGSGPPPACSAFSPDGRWLAWLGHDGVVRLRDVATGKEVRNFPANPPAPAPGQAAGNRVSTLAFSPDGRTLLAGYHVAQQLVPDLGRGFGTGLAPVPSGPLQVPVCLWEVAAGKLRQQFDLSMPAGSSGHPGGLLLEGQGKIRFDFQFLPGGGSVTGAWFAPDGRSVALGTGTTIYVYDLLKGKISRQFEAGLTSGQALALSPDGKYLATAGMDGTVGLSEVASGRDLGPLRGHLGQLSCVAFSPDGKSLASAGTDTTVLIWDLAALREAGQRRPHLAPDQLAVLWKQLAEEDAAQAYLAVRALQAAPESVVPYLRERLKPVPTVDTRRIAQLIADLDSDSFDVRKQATAELEKVGELAETALEQVLAGQPSLEVRQRAEALLDRLRMAVTSPEQLRQLRAVEVLEQTSTPEARGLLEKLAEGAPEARLTRDAQESLARLVRGN